jgi:probable HAF family extracellular repeat protein
MRFSFGRASRLILALTTVLAVQAAGGTLYHVTDFGAWGGPSSISVHAINSSGQVVGALNLGSNSVYHAVLYSNGVVTDLGSVNGTNSYAYGIAGNGQIVGSTNISGNNVRDVFLYANGTMNDLGTFGSPQVEPRGMNNGGQIVGDADFGNNELHAFVYSNGVMTDLGTLGGTQSYTEAINSSGQAVGTAYTASNAKYRAFLYSNGMMNDLGGCWVARSARLMRSTTTDRLPVRAISKRILRSTLQSTTTGL